MLYELIAIVLLTWTGGLSIGFGFGYRFGRTRAPLRPLTYVDPAAEFGHTMLNHPTGEMP